MVGNHVADLRACCGEWGEIPIGLTDYIRACQDYGHHRKPGSSLSDFVPDDIVDRVCVLGTVEDHIAKLETLKDVGVNQLNIYLLHDTKEKDVRYLRGNHTGPRRADFSVERTV
jgi:hypothetical protein